MKVLSKTKLRKIFIGKNRTAMNDVTQEIAIMKKLVKFFGNKTIIRTIKILSD